MPPRYSDIPVSTRLAAWRAHRGLSYRQISEKTGITICKLCRIEKGHTTKVDDLLSVVKALDTNPLEFFGSLPKGA